jgi:hypothetical protein
VSNNICAVPGCGKNISRKHMMCMPHWSKVPGPMAQDLFKARDAVVDAVTKAREARPFTMGRVSLMERLQAAHTKLRELKNEACERAMK